MLRRRKRVKARALSRRRSGRIATSPAAKRRVRIAGDANGERGWRAPAASVKGAGRRSVANIGAFSRFSVLIAIIIGLAITLILQGLGWTILHRRSVRGYWPTYLRSILLLVVAAQMWRSMFGCRDLIKWNFGIFSVILLQTVVFYLAAAILSPPASAGTLDLQSAYYANRAWFFLLLAATALARLLKEVVTIGALPTAANTAFHAVFIAGSVAAAASSLRVHHAIYAPAAALVFGAYVVLLFFEIS